MNNQTRKQIFILLMLTLMLGQIAFAQSAGGSNYVFYDMGRAFTDRNAWNDCGELKPVIATYHLNPNTVFTQLAAMRQGGQQKITLLVWYTRFDNPGGCGNYVWGHVVSSTGGHLIPQHQENLRQIVTLIRDLGFNELDFRFETQSESDPGEWTQWNESLYQENRNFIFNTRSIVEQVLTNSSVKRRYDLDAELVGEDNDQAKPYVKRLWTDYNAAYGKADTYGFSLAAVRPGLATFMIDTYDETSFGRPNLYAFDVYGDEYNTLQYLSDELASRGEQQKPIVIQEAYYNDAQAAQNFRLAKQNLGLNITHVMQWPVARGVGGAPQSSVNWTEQYFNYAESPKIIAADPGCDDRYCVWVLGESFDSSAYIDIRRNDGSETVIARVGGADLNRENQEMYQGFSFGIWDPAIRSILNNPGITITVMNANDGRTSNAVAIERGTVPGLLNIIQNPDMEEVNGSVPANWIAGGSVPISFYSGGPSFADAATNQWYARIRVDDSSGGAWLSSHLTPVTGGNRVFANAYIRSGMDNVRITIIEYDQNGNGIKSNPGPSFTPVGWSYNNYFQRVGSWSVKLAPNTHYIIVNVSGIARPGTSSVNPGYLDVDDVSAWQRPD